MSADILARALAQAVRGKLASTRRGDGSALVGSPLGDSLQDAVEGYATRTAMKALSAYDGARTYLRESGRQGTWIFRIGDYASKVAADAQEGLYALANAIPASTGAWVRHVDGTFNAKWWGAKGDNTTDDSAAAQAAIDAVAAIGGGTVLFPPGTYIVQNVQLKQSVRILGAGRGVNGFSQSTGNTAFRLPAAPTMDGVCAIGLTAGGSGYATAPIVAITGGGGNGAAAYAVVSGGVVTGVILTDPGSGYTSAPTVSLSGGGGSGATAAAEVAARIFYTTGATALITLEMSGFTLLGRGAGQHQGLHLHYVHCPSLRDINAYALGLEAIRWDRGAGGSMAHLLLFGLNNTARSAGYRTGTLRIGGSDCRLTDIEAGADPSNDTAALRNCAMYFDKTSSAGLYTNLIAEGADVGCLIEGSTSRFVNVRADINYGHGFWLTRTDANATPPWQNQFVNCWGHRNSRYTTNTFDNFRIETGQAIAQTVLIGYRSSAATADSWKPRYGLYNGASDTQVVGLASDAQELTGKYAAASASTAGPSQPRASLTSLAAAASLNVAGLSEVRIINAGGAVTVTDLTGGNPGDELDIQTSASNVTLGHGGTSANKMYLAGTQNRLLDTWRIARFKNFGGTWYEIQPWTKQAAIGSLTVSATTGTLPTADGILTIANAASPTPTELLEYCREQDAKINAIRAALIAAGISS